MALPATTAALKAWLVDVTLSTVAVDLGWTSTSAPVEAAVDLTALILGHTVETEGATAKLIAVAEWQAWQRAVDALTARFDAASGGDKATLSQQVEQAERRLAGALAVAQRYTDVQAYLSGGAALSPFFAFSTAAGGRGW